jgi:hypothetical protein
MGPLGNESHTTPRVPKLEAKPKVHSDDAAEGNSKVVVSTEKGVVVAAVAAVAAVVGGAASF